MSLSNSERRVVSEKCLASLGFVFVHYFSDTMLLYLEVEFWMSYGTRTYISVYQAYFVISTKQFKVGFVLENRSLNIWQT